MWDSGPTTITIRAWATVSTVSVSGAGSYTRSLLEAGTPFAPPPSPLPTPTRQSAPREPSPLRRRRHRVQARAPPLHS